MASADGTSMQKQVAKPGPTNHESAKPKIVPFLPGASASRHFWGAFFFKATVLVQRISVPTSGASLKPCTRLPFPIKHATMAKIAKWVCTRCSCNVSLDRRQYLAGFGLWRQLAHATNKGNFQDLSGKLSLWRLGVFWYRLEVACICHFWNFTKLHFREISENFRVGGFNPSEKYSSKWVIFPQIRDENKKFWVATTQFETTIQFPLWNHHLGWPRLRFFSWYDLPTPRLPDHSIFPANVRDSTCEVKGEFVDDWWIHLFNWFIHLSIHWLIDWLMYWFINLFIDLFIYWLIDWLIDWLFEAASSAASLWANVWLIRIYIGITIWPTANENNDSGEASKQPRKRDWKMCNRPQEKGQPTRKRLKFVRLRLYIHTY